MNLPEYSLRNAKVIWFFLFVLLAGGALGFSTLGKKEDSVFVIKSASLVCSYPGATPPEVEELITEPIEREVQSMRLVHKITSESYYGVSKIQVELDPATPAREIPPAVGRTAPQGAQRPAETIPAGASQITVADDFGGCLRHLLRSLRRWGILVVGAARLGPAAEKRPLVTIDGVQKVTLYGEQTPVVNVYVSLAALANFSIRPETIVSTIGQQNSIVDSGEKQAGKLRIQILEDGTYKTLDDLADQLLFATSGKQYRLGDIARVERGYAEPPQTMMRVDGRRAVGIGISTEAGVDVVKAGAKIDGVLASLTRQMPVGMELTVLYPENRIAREANSTFILNLAESVAIVILIIMLVMGFRAGVLIGSSLLFSIGGTLLLMQFLGEGLNRTSLAGFIIAMGMLVDNAIVVTDNAQQAMLRGAGRSKAVVDGANAPRWSLLGATLIAIFSFLPLYLAPSSVAEIVKPLFVVLALSLLLSWVLALTQTPLFGNFMLRVKPLGRDPYDTKFLPRFRPLSGRPAAPAMGGRGRCRRTVRPFAGRHGADASELLPVARQTLFPCRRAPARGVRHPRYGAQPAFDGGVAPRTARGEDRLDDARLHAAALLSGQQQRFDASQFRQRPRRTARQTADRIRRGAVQCLGHRESPRRMAALVALQALARARCGHRFWFPSARTPIRCAA